MRDEPAPASIEDTAVNDTATASATVGAAHATLGPWRALGLVALYFVLQIAVALAWSLLARGLGAHAAILRQMGASGMLLLVLLAAAVPILLLVRTGWPRRWTAAALPGFGVRWPGWRWIGAGMLLAAAAQRRGQPVRTSNSMGTAAANSTSSSMPLAPIWRRIAACAPRPRASSDQASATAICRTK